MEVMSLLLVVMQPPVQVHTEMAGKVQVLTYHVQCRIVTLQASSSQLLLVRAIVHPLIWSIMTQLLLHTARHLGEHAVLPVLAGTILLQAT